MTILAIDSASVSGWCVAAQDRPAGYGHADVRDPLVLHALAGRLVSEYAPELVVIEDSFMGKNVGTVKALSRIVGQWELAFAIRGVTTELMMASDWQEKALAGLITRASKRAQRKEAARRWVLASFKLACTEDECDAIAMAIHVWRRENLKARVRGALSRPRSRSLGAPSALPGSDRSRPAP